MKKVLDIATVLGCLGVMAWTLITASRFDPWMSIAGPLLAALAPLLFVCGFRRWALFTPNDPHPVLVSVVSGLGAVLAMMAVTRFGDNHESSVIAAGIALALWLLWVRGSWRPRLGGAIH